jgi:hypothetical protein
MQRGRRSIIVFATDPAGPKEKGRLRTANIEARITALPAIRRETKTIGSARTSAGCIFGRLTGPDRDDYREIGIARRGVAPVTVLQRLRDQRRPTVPSVDRLSRAAIWEELLRL